MGFDTFSNQDVNFALPDFTKPDSEKGEEYHKQYVRAITNQSLHNSYDLDYSLINECYEFYNGTDTGEEFQFLQESEDGSVLPARWINFNKIKVKIDLLLGELVKKNYEIRVQALNTDARVRRLEEKEAMRIEMRTRKIARELEEQFGLPLNPQTYVPETEDELDEYFDYNYKQKTEYIVENALKYVRASEDYDYERLAAFRDMLIAGRCIFKSEIWNGMPKLRRVDPRFFIFDTNSTDDFLTDSSFFGEVRYMEIGEAAEKYGLDKKELKEVYHSYTESFKMHSHNFAYNDRWGQLLDGTGVRFFKRERGELRVLVISAVWVDTKEWPHKKSVDKYGNVHIKPVKSKKDGEDIISAQYKIWRKGTLIGGQIIRDWGELENMHRSIDNPTEAFPPYICLIPNYLNGKGISKVHQMKGLQKLKDITMYNVQLAMARAGAKGFVYDTSQTPEEWDVHTVIKYLKSVGIAFVDASKDGGASYNQFKEIDMTLSDSVSRYLEISFALDREMDAISGVNEERQGVIQNSSQAVGVTQSALIQSSLATETLFTLFNKMFSRALTHQAGLIKVAWADKDRFAPIIGDFGVDWLQEDIDLELDDYGVFVEAVPPMLDDMATYKELVLAALQSGDLGFKDAMNLLMEKDLRVAVRKYEKALAEAEQREIEQQLAMQEQQFMMQQQAQIEAEQRQFQQQQEAKQLSLASEEVKSRGRLQEILAKGRVEMLKEQLRNMRERR